MSYEDFQKIFDFTMRENGVEVPREATAEDIFFSATGEAEIFTGEF
jgi:hypothetical protein